jgi:membrane protein implicated in regulation of membrane protease activity
MWIEPIVRFSFQVVAGMCWLVAGVMAFALLRFAQPGSTAMAWWAVVFFVAAGLALILVARRLKRFRDLPQIVDTETPSDKTP